LPSVELLEPVTGHVGHSALDDVVAGHEELRVGQDNVQGRFLQVHHDFDASLKNKGDFKGCGILHFASTRDAAGDGFLTNMCETFYLGAELVRKPANVLATIGTRRINVPTYTSWHWNHSIDPRQEEL
jgi:hypothetical protein